MGGRGASSGKGGGGRASNRRKMRTLIMKAKNKAR